MIFDSHAHYFYNDYKDDIDAVLDECRKNGVVGILNCATTYESCEESIKQAEKYDILYPALGIYPHHTIDYGEFDKVRFKKLFENKKITAVGEIGLDYYYDTAPRELQLSWVKGQVSIANELNLPVSFHSRDSHEDTLKLLKELRPKGVLHCFSGSTEMAREIIKIGMYIGIPATVTFKNAKVIKEVVREIPLENMVLETDAPYMSPVPFRGKRNRSDYIKYIAEAIAEIKNVSVDAVLDVTTKNCQKLFK